MSKNRQGNTKTPDIVGEGITHTTLRCHTCDEIIKVGERVDIYISYSFYYDHYLFFYKTCDKPHEMWSTWKSREVRRDKV